MADIQWFYAKSKVPVCLAITDSFHFLNKLNYAGILTEEEALELQGDSRTGHRVVYECLCWIEDKDISSEHFFTFLFQKSLLKRYPDLKPIHAEYIKGKYRHGIHSTTDEDKDPLIFAQEKVQICLTITDRFPFLHGLQDLTILSESESLKLQADERPVSRVIYESLSLIEKKDLKLNIVFEYIFQQCYLKLYPGLQDILQEPSGEFVAPFNGGQYPMFNIATDLLEFFEHNKTYICEAVNARFPFLHGLYDRGLLSYIQLLKLQANKKATKEVLYEALCHIKSISDIENLFAYLFQEFYLKLYPDLHVILQCLNAALTLDICPPSTASCTERIPETRDSNTPIAVIVKDEFMELPDQISGTPSTVLYEDETREALEQDSNEHPPVFPKDEMVETPDQDPNEPSPGSDGTEYRMQPTPFSNPPERDSKVKNGEKTCEGSDDTSLTVRKCRMQPISYSEPPDLDWDVDNGRKDKAPENSKLHKSGKRKSQETKINVLGKSIQGLKETPELLRAPENSKLHKSGKRKSQETKINVLGKSIQGLKETPELLRAPENTKRHKSRKRKGQETKIDVFRKGILGLKQTPDLLQVTKPVTVKLEFPKQVFNEKFKVRCGNKIGTFKKRRWKGDSRKDLCICCEDKKFSVTAFEKYGGRAASKCWKKTIQCWNPETSHMDKKKDDQESRLMKRCAQGFTALMLTINMGKWTKAGTLPKDPPDGFSATSGYRCSSKL